jgi:hypothetical protein
MSRSRALFQRSLSFDWHEAIYLRQFYLFVYVIAKNVWFRAITQNLDFAAFFINSERVSARMKCSSVDEPEQS